MREKNVINADTSSMHDQNLKNMIVIVKFTRGINDSEKQFITEAIVLNQSISGIKLKINWVDADKEEWYMRQQVQIMEIIGEAYKNWYGKLVRKYY